MIKNLKFKIKNYHESVLKVVFYLILLLLPAQLGHHFWPSFAYVSGIRVDYLSPTVYITDILILLLFIGWIFTIGSNFKNLDIKNSIKIKNFKLKILFFLLLLIGIILSKNPMVGFYGLLKLGEFIFFGFYVSRNIDKVSFSNTMLIFSIGVIVESLLAIGQFFYQGSIGGLLYFLGERMFTSQTPGIANASINGELILRPYGTFPHPNVLAGYLTIAMTLISSKFKVQSSKFKTIAHVISLTLGTVALSLTMSRVAIAIWLVILVRFVMLNLFQHLFCHSGLSRIRSRNKFGMTGIIVSFIVFISIIFIPPLRFRFIETSLFEESVELRMQLIQNSILMIREHPIFGIGINSFLTTLPSYTSFETNAFFQQLQPVHNIFLLIAAQTGIVGLIFFLLFIHITLKKIKNQKSKIKNQIFLIVLVLGMFDHYFLTLQQGQLLFAFISGLLWARGRIDL